MWEIKYHPEAVKELEKLDGSVRIQVLKGILKVSQNPAGKKSGGYGEPLGNKGGSNLTGYYKIKYRKIGIRVVYRLIVEKAENGTKQMYILVISAKADNEVYDTAAKRK